MVIGDWWGGSCGADGIGKIDGGILQWNFFQFLGKTCWRIKLREGIVGGIVVGGVVCGVWAGIDGVVVEYCWADGIRRSVGGVSQYLLCGFLNKFGCLEIDVLGFVGGYFIGVGVIGDPWCRIVEVVGDSC
jgi:hypothetical protein